MILKKIYCKVDVKQHIYDVELSMVYFPRFYCYELILITSCDGKHGNRLVSHFSHIYFPM